MEMRETLTKFNQVVNMIRQKETPLNIKMKILKNAHSDKKLLVIQSCFKINWYFITSIAIYPSHHLATQGSKVQEWECLPKPSLPTHSGTCDTITPTHKKKKQKHKVSVYACKKSLSKVKPPLEGQ